MSEATGGRHLDAMDIAAFVNGNVDAATRARVLAHVNDCPECRDEIMEASHIASKLPSRGRWQVPLTAFAIAAALLIMLLPKAGTRAPSEPVRGGPAASPSLRGSPAPTDTTGVPTALTPRDRVDHVDRLVWSAASGALRYRARLYEEGGVVIWSATTVDTVVLLPDSVRLGPRRTYFWKVEANPDGQHAASSDLVSFTVLGSRR